MRVVAAEIARRLRAARRSGRSAQPGPLPLPHRRHVERRQVAQLPGIFPMVPARALRLVHPDELELHHEALLLRHVLHLAMPDVVMDQQEAAGRQAARHFRLHGLVRLAHLVLAAGDHAGRSLLERRRLRHVHDHRPARAMIADAAAIAPVAVLVRDLRRRARLVVVQRAMRMHGVIRAEHAGERAGDDRVAEQLADLGAGRQQVVAGIEIGIAADQRIEALVDGAVEALRQARLEQEVAMRDEALHLLVGEQDRRAGHSVLLVLSAAKPSWMAAMRRRMSSGNGPLAACAAANSS